MTIKGTPVDLAQMLDARERRAIRQRGLLHQFHKPLVCFTMNIAGPVKNNLLIRRGFELGTKLLVGQFRVAHVDVIYLEQRNEPTGNEAIYVVDLDPSDLKKLAVELEDRTTAGRLFDIDVLLPSGEKISREALGLGDRKCLICNGPVGVCARSRAHTVAKLQARTVDILEQAIMDEDAEFIASQAVRALLYEVCTTPKPGLVDRENNGSHKDMDIFTFMSSSSALWPYFETIARTGIQTSGSPALETFAALRFPGKLAEGAMLAATDGVNTHKGAIFTTGLLCAALGRIVGREISRESWRAPEKILAECAAMTRGLVAAEMAELTQGRAKTSGQRCFLHYGITGVRGQAEEGFPAVLNVGLPVLERGLSEGLSLNDSGTAALIALIAAGIDTNLIARGGLEAQKNAARRCVEVLKESAYPDKETLERLNADYVEKNLSPGGSADLLALCYMLHFVKEVDSGQWIGDSGELDVS